jgi:flavin-dependent dehydrogenase
VRRQLALDPKPKPHRRFGVRRHVAIAPWSEFVEVHWCTRGEAYVTPVGPELVGIAVLAPQGVTFDEVLDDLPRLRDRIGGREWETPMRGAGPLRQAVRQRVSGRVLLVGDAAGYVDALTGEGIRTGLACARAAVAAIDRGDPAAYERDWHRLTRSYRLLTTALVGGTRPAWARARVVGTACALPWLYAAAVESLAGGS